MSQSLKWIYGDTGGYLTREGCGVDVYSFVFMSIPATASDVIFSNGNTGAEKNRLHTSVSNNVDRDNLNGNGDYISFSDGVYVTVDAVEDVVFGVLVYVGTPEA